LGPAWSAAAAPDYQWVRYGPDLLLVDLRSGEVVEVVSDVFYY
jgi:hypothetical protein